MRPSGRRGGATEAGAGGVPRCGATIWWPRSRRRLGWWSTGGLAPGNRWAEGGGGARARNGVREGERRWI